MSSVATVLNQVALTPQQEKLWSDTKVAMLWHCPAFSHILYNMMDFGKQTAIFTDNKELCPIAATDGSALILNPETFFKFNLNERMFIVVHEIMHCILNHLVLAYQFQRRGKVTYPDGTTLDYNHELMNIAEDLVINDILVESKVGTMPSIGWHNTQLGSAKDSFTDVYQRIYKQKPESTGKGGFDEHLEPGTSQGKDGTTASGERNEAAWATAVAAAADSARAQGKLPAGLERLFQEILNPKVDWRDKIQALFARKVGSGSFDWRRADRRLIVRDTYAPGRSGFGAGTVVVAVDTSGSIGERELDMFFAEMAGILEDIHPRRMLIAWCDAKLHRVDEAEEAGDLNTIRCKGAPGGGGTSFVPVFDWIREERIEPDTVVYLTDGYGTFPDREPSYPVIWGDIGGTQYPFGDVVEIPKQAS